MSTKRIGRRWVGTSRCDVPARVQRAERILEHARIGVRVAPLNAAPTAQRSAQRALPNPDIRRAAEPPRPPFLINTPLQRGVWRPKRIRNRFNGFPGMRETVETVSEVLPARNTPLKRGVNESAWCRAWWLRIIRAKSSVSFAIHLGLFVRCDRTWMRSEFAPMEISETIQCPFCGQSFDLVIDTSIARQRFTTDCEVCCRPVEVWVESQPGEVLSLEVRSV